MKYAVLSIVSLCTLLISNAAAGANAGDFPGAVAIGASYSGTAAPTNGLMVQGNTGIGTTSPTSILQTADSAAKTANYTSVYLSNLNTSSTASINKTGLFVDSNGTWNGTSAANVGLTVSVSGGTNNYAATFLGGPVGIGTTAPVGQLSLGNPQTDASLRTYGTLDMGFFNFYQAQNFPSANNYNRSLDIVSASSLGAAKSIIRFMNQQSTSGGPAEAMRIDQAGNVGIGTTTPVVTLDLSGRTDALALPVGTTANRPSGGNLINGEVRYNSSNSNIEGYTNGTWLPLTSISSDGRLSCTGCTGAGSTTLAYCPFKGNLKTTAAQGNYTIPSSCLTATTTSMYLNGVSSTSLSANTAYYIYLWQNGSGVWVLDASTTGHATDGSTGIEVKSTDNTRTLVGMIQTDGSVKVALGGTKTIVNDVNTVATWDNRRPVLTSCTFATPHTSTSSGSLTEINLENHCYFMAWANEAVSFSSSQSGYSGTNGGTITTAVTLDAASTGNKVSIWDTYQPTASIAIPLVASGATVWTEGMHYTVMAAQVAAGTTVTYAANKLSSVISQQ